MAAPTAKSGMSPKIGLVVLAAVLFGTSGIAKGLGPDGLPALFTGAWRTLVGGLALCAISLFDGRRLPWRPATVTLGAGAVIVYQLCFFAALARLGVAATVVVSIGTGPIVAAGIDALGPMRRRPSPVFLAGVGLAVAGVALVSWPLGDLDLLGLVLALVAGAAVPLYGAAAQVLMTDEAVGPLEAMASIFGLAAVAVSPIAVTSAVVLAGDVDPPPLLGTLGVVVWLGLVATGLAYWLWGRGLDGLPLSVVAVATMAEPAAATILSWIALGDPVRATMVAGVVVVAAGVWLATRSAVPESSVEPDRGDRR